MLGMPYSDVDCIGLIRQVIRRSPGGAADYTTAGTNTLWDSYNASAKYRDLTWRQEGISAARAGMLAFKRSGDDVHHVGLVTGDGTVIHSSSARGAVVETEVDSSWHLLAQHRYIEVAAATGTEERMEQALYTAIVATQQDPLRVRESPVFGEILGSVPRGRAVEVLSWGENGWAKIRYNELEGYASAMYLERVEEPNDADPDGSGEDKPVEIDGEKMTTLVRGDGQTIRLAGSWRVEED